MSTLLRRMGNKSKIAPILESYFPSHDCYIEPFFGAGGMFFNKKLAKYNILNDLDSDVYNLFNILTDEKLYSELCKLAEITPVHDNLWNHWKINLEQDPVKKAMRFLYLSNYGLYGKTNTLKVHTDSNAKKIMLANLEAIKDRLKFCIFTNRDFRKCLQATRGRSENEKIFIYCDPPYLGTDNNYSDSFKKQDFVDLLDSLDGFVKKYFNSSYAISEFDHPFVLESAKGRGLNIIYLGERQAIKKRANEILITNYENLQLSIFNQKTG